MAILYKYKHQDTGDAVGTAAKAGAYGSALGLGVLVIVGGLLAYMAITDKPPRGGASDELRGRRVAAHRRAGRAITSSAMLDSSAWDAEL